MIITPFKPRMRVEEEFSRKINLSEFRELCIRSGINIGDDCKGRIPLYTPKITVYVYHDKYAIPVLSSKFDVRCSLGFVMEYIDQIVQGEKADYWDIVTRWVALNWQNLKVKEFLKQDIANAFKRFGRY